MKYLISILLFVGFTSATQATNETTTNMIKVCYGYDNTKETATEIDTMCLMLVAGFIESVHFGGNVDKGTFFDHLDRCLPDDTNRGNVARRVWRKLNSDIQAYGQFTLGQALVLGIVNSYCTPARTEILKSMLKQAGNRENL